MDSPWIAVKSNQGNRKIRFFCHQTREKSSSTLRRATQCVYDVVDSGVTTPHMRNPFWGECVVSTHMTAAHHVAARSRGHGALALDILSPGCRQRPGNDQHHTPNKIFFLAFQQQNVVAVVGNTLACAHMTNTSSPCSLFGVVCRSPSHCDTQGEVPPSPCSTSLKVVKACFCDLARSILLSNPPSLEHCLHAF